MKHMQYYIQIEIHGSKKIETFRINKELTRMVMVQTDYNWKDLIGDEFDLKAFGKYGKPIADYTIVTESQFFEKQFVDAL